MNKTITYRYKNKLYKITVSMPYTNKVSIAVKNILCSYIKDENFIIKPDYYLGLAIDRYNAEKSIGLI